MPTAMKKAELKEYAGYVTSRRNNRNKEWAVVLRAVEAGIDADGKYVTLCDAHSTFVSSDTRQLAEDSMFDVDFCPYCTGELEYDF